MSQLEAREKAIRIAMGMGDMGNLERNAARFEAYLLKGVNISDAQPMMQPSIHSYIESPFHLGLFS